MLQKRKDAYCVTDLEGTLTEEASGNDEECAPAMSAARKPSSRRNHGKKRSVSQFNSGTGYIIFVMLLIVLKSKVHVWWMHEIVQKLKK